MVLFCIGINVILIKMKYGIVGSRRRIDRHNVLSFIKSLKNDDIVISGGCRGIDTWAEEIAKSLGIKTIIYKPDLKNIKSKGDMIQRYYDRNKKIAQACDVLIAFVSSDRKGGTENTIKYATELGKIVEVK